MLIALAGGYWAYKSLTSPQRVSELAIRYIQRHVFGEVTVEKASFSMFGGVELEGVRVEGVAEDDTSFLVEGGDGELLPLFECDHVKLIHDPIALLAGNVVVRSITADRPEVAILRDRSGGKTNLSRSLRSLASSSSDEFLQLPTVELRRARFSVRQPDDEGLRVIEDLTLTVRGRPSVEQPLSYDVTWQDPATRTSGHSLVDLSGSSIKNVAGGLPWMSIEAVMAVVDAKYDGAGSWCDLLGLGGRVRAQDYNVFAEKAEHQKRFVTIELTDASISIPTSDLEAELPSDQRYLRFEHVNGFARVTDQGLEAEFKGQFHGSECEVSTKLGAGAGKIDTLDDVDIEAKISIEGWRVPRVDPDAPADEARFVCRWPKMEWVYSRYEPAGTISAEVSLSKKAGADQPVKLKHAYLDVLSGSLCCVYFPYPVEEVTGVIEVTEQGLVLHDICTRRAGATLSLSGTLAHPVGLNGGELVVEGRDIPFDETLYYALGEHRRRMWDRFQPSGELDATVVLTLAPVVGDDRWGRWSRTVSAEFEDAAAEYVGFPYGVDGISGWFTSIDDRVEFELSGMHDKGTIDLNGFVSEQNKRVLDASILIDAAGLQLDGDLLRALPEDLRSTVEPFNAEGVFDANVDMSWDPSTRRLRPAGSIHVEDVALKHDKLPLQLTDVQADLDFAGNEIVIHEAAARHGDAKVSVVGKHSLLGGAGTTALDVHCENFVLDDSLRAALPESVVEELGDWDVSGGVVADVSIVSHRGEGERSLVTDSTIRLSGATVKHEDLPLPFEDVFGTIISGAEGVRCPSLRAKYGNAAIDLTLDVTGSVSEGSGWLSLSVSNLACDSHLRDSLPEKLRACWDSVAPVGTLSLEVENLAWRRNDGRIVEVEVEAEVALEDVGVPGLLDLEHAFGKIGVSGLLLDSAGGTNIRGDLELRTADLFGRHITGGNAAYDYLHTEEGEGLLRMPALHAQLYEGSVDGDLVVDFHPDEVRYKIDTLARKVNLEPFLNADLLDDEDYTEPVAARGWADARLSVSGVVGDVRQRRGMGGAEIIDGRIYRMPVVLAILNFLNPTTPPDPEAFNYANVTFSVQGNEMQFATVLLNGPALKLEGSGSMSLVDRHIDLFLRAGDRWTGIPVVSDMFNAVANGLVELHVTGTLSKPSVRARTLPRVNKALKDLFKKKERRSRSDRG